MAKWEYLVGWRFRLVQERTCHMGQRAVLSQTRLSSLLGTGCQFMRRLSLWLARASCTCVDAYAGRNGARAEGAEALVFFACKLGTQVFSPDQGRQPATGCVFRSDHCVSELAMYLCSTVGYRCRDMYRMTISFFSLPKAPGICFVSSAAWLLPDTLQAMPGIRQCTTLTTCLSFPPLALLSLGYVTDIPRSQRKLSMSSLYHGSSS
ncbi:hypothetical protein VTK56DRAFT_5608 [Thermocarpiscus australiensis]